jgi:large repetitive protein
MRSFAWLRRRRRTVASVSIVTASVLAVTGFAVAYEGFPTTEVDLHDGGVWVTKQSSLLVGHFNHESRVLDSGLRAAGDDYDILQAGSTVVVVDDDDSTMTTIDPAMIVLTDSADIPSGADVRLGGASVAVLSPEGSLWVVPSAGVAGFAVEATEPLAELGEGADVAVGRDGTVYAVSAASREIVTVPVSPEGEPGEPARRVLDGVEEDAALSITVVGTTAAVLDGDTGTVYTSGGARTLIPGGDTAVLQQPSAEASALTLATAGELVQVPLDGSAPVQTPAGGEGEPAEPVLLNGCSYAAWGGSARFVRDCSDDANDLATDIPDIDPTAELRFRQNRDVVVLNDVIGGAAWMASDSMQRVDNWEDITPPEGESEEDEQTTEETVETTLPERTEVNTPPVAVDDDFGVRPGRTTILPVLDNDTDADGDVLTITLPNGDPGIGQVQPINNGTALQIAVSDDAGGSDSFVYEVDDGRGGTDQATVRLSVRPLDTNAAPVQKRVTSVVVEAGSSVSYNAITDWIDPDGDDVFLSQVTPDGGDEADFTSDGRISYRAIGGQQGRKDVPIVVSDGQDATEGIIRFDIRPVGSTVPVTNADHVVVRAGQTATVAPLTNDTSSSREPLRLTRVDEVPGAEIVSDFANKTFTFRTPAPGVYYVQYLVAAGANAVPGLVRIDVLPDEDTDLPPVAQRDVAMLPSGGDVLVNVLANDSDPSGGILVVQSVTVEPASGVSVAVLNHETLRITDQAALSEQTRIAYRISNGTRTAEGEVVVIPVPAPDRLEAPVAEDDTAVVRAGDVVTIPVLGNDYHPNDDTIRVSPDLVAPLPDPAQGEIFVSQDTVRFRASDQPGTVYATYEAVDSTGQRDAGYVTIQVLPVNPETNQAPRPRDITARALSGTQVRIPVPLDGLDPDGDSVELVGIDSAPRKGKITETGANFLQYESFGDATGADAFTYRVRDRLGAEATASVRVGIAPAEAANQAPYAVKDSVVMRPGREVALPVLANDSDPDGDTIALVDGGLVLPDVAGLDARVVGDRVVVTSPDRPVETSLQYTIRDARGAEAMAVLQVTVADDVPLQRPIARDDRVRPEDVVDDASVDIDLLANDEDPDGTTDALEISVDGQATVQADGVVSVPLTEQAQLLTYTITDADDLTASAFLFVPALGDLPPTLTSTEGIEVMSGETVQIPLADHVRAAGGRDVVVTEAAKVSAAHANGAELVQDQRTLVYTSADGYFGQDALTFEVTDGTGPDDPEGRKSTLTLPITVLPPDNQQPTFVNGQMDVAPGEDAASLDLLSLTTDPDEGDLERMRYSIVGGAGEGMDAAIDGQSLRVSASSNTPKGTAATIQLQIEDGETEAVTGSVTVRVTASTRPLATANDDVIAEADQGREIVVPVLANDFNPFPDRPLRVVAAATETGAGSAEVRGDQVAVTPGAEFFGTMVVRYRLQDATEDADREVEGRIRLTVQGRPEPPGVPTVSSVQDRTVVLSWTPPANNGAAITGYTVTSTAGDYTTSCPATTCTLTGLTNNVEYNFVVTATNRVGESDPSQPSETARPDARPDTPQPPTLRFGDASLTVAWSTPSTPGSPVESFTLEISPAPPSGLTQKSNVTGNSLVWEGLENGVNYQVRVRAHNRAPEPSSWSGYSAPEIPAGPPAQPAAPTTSRLSPVGSQAQLQVNWTAPAQNGDAIQQYSLKVFRGGAQVNELFPSAGQTSQAVVVEASSTDYTFTVAARNKAGWGQASPASAPRRAFTPPAPPTITNATTPQPDSAVIVDYTRGETNGADASAVSIQFNVGGGWRSDWDGRTIRGLQNGQAYTVQLRAVTNQDGTQYESAASNSSPQVTPYGTMGAPPVGWARRGQSVEFSWTPPATNGRPIAYLEIRVDNGGWERVGAGNGSRTVGNGYDQTHSIAVRAVDSEGNAGAQGTAQGTTEPRPQPRAWVTRGGSAVGQPNCSSSACAYFQLNTQDFPAGTYRVSCVNSRTGQFTDGSNYAIPANGSIGMRCYYGYAGEQVWVNIEGYGESERRTW